VTKLI